MAMGFNTFLNWEKTTRDTLDFKRIYVDMAGEFIAGAVLSEIVYWFLPNKNGAEKTRIHKDGHSWIAIKREEWFDRIRLTPDQADTAINRLIRRGIVEKKIYRFDGSPTTHLRIMEEKFMELWEEINENPPSNPFTSPKDSDENGKSISPYGEIENPQKDSISPYGDIQMGNLPISLTETTAETTFKKHVENSKNEFSTGVEEKTEIQKSIDPLDVIMAQVSGEKEENPVSDISEGLSPVERIRESARQALLRGAREHGTKVNLDNIPEDVRPIMGTFVELFGRTPVGPERAFWIKTIREMLQLGLSCEDVTAGYKMAQKKDITIKSPKSIITYADENHRKKDRKNETSDAYRTYLETGYYPV